MSLLGTILPGKFKVPPQIKQWRMAQCNACHFLKKSTRSCGTLLLGDTVQHNFMPITLCGCLVNEKTELPGERCPAGKWLEYTK